MEGFVQPTKAQKLASLRATLQRAYASNGSIGEKKPFENQLRRIDETIRSEPHGNDQPARHS